MAAIQTSRGLWPTPHHSIDQMWAYGTVNAQFQGTTAVAAWPSANLAIYQPIRIKNVLKVLKLWYQTSTTGTDNVDIGLYNQAGTRLVSSGPIAKSAAANSEEVKDVTDTTIFPGLHYLAMSCSAVTSSFSRVAPGAPLLAGQGCRTEASAGTLPATATWVVDNTLNFMPFVGILVEPTVA